MTPQNPSRPPEPPLQSPHRTAPRHRPNTLRRIRLVCAIVQRHYEAGNYAKSYFKVWRQYVNPVYPCCYRTLLNYVNTPLGRPDADTAGEARQLKLFENEPIINESK